MQVLNLDLQAELPGRLWDGKEAVPASLAAVVVACPGAFDAAQSTAVVDALVAAAGTGAWQHAAARFSGRAQIVIVDSSCACSHGCRCASRRRHAAWCCAGRKQAAYKKAALLALQKVLAAFPQRDHFAAVAPLLLPELRPSSDAQPPIRDAAVSSASSHLALPQATCVDSLCS